MKKIVFLTAIFFTIIISQVNANNGNGNGNSSTDLTTPVNIGLSNALEITFTGNSGNGSGSGNGSTIGDIITLPFSTTNDFLNGVQSTEQELKVRSNKDFNVTVNTDATTFTVTNNGVTTTSTMPASVLNVKVATNSTGGNIAGTFAGFTNLSASAANLLSNCSKGGNQRFTIMYNAHPGYNYPTGTYSINVIYTATQN